MRARPSLALAWRERIGFRARKPLSVQPRGWLAKAELVSGKIELLRTDCGYWLPYASDQTQIWSDKQLFHVRLDSKSITRAFAIFLEVCLQWQYRQIAASIELPFKNRTT